MIAYVNQRKPARLQDEGVYIVRTQNTGLSVARWFQGQGWFRVTNYGGRGEPFCAGEVTELVKNVTSSYPAIT